MAPRGLLGEFNCPKCGHRKKHKFNVMGKAECVDCPNGVCVDPHDEDPLTKTTVASLGMGFLNEMGKDALISEIVTAHCVKLHTFDMDTLRRMVIMVRLQGTRDRLMAEAGFSPEDEGWMG